jgi:hypothetical protein
MAPGQPAAHHQVAEQAQRNHEETYGADGDRPAALGGTGGRAGRRASPRDRLEEPIPDLRRCRRAGSGATDPLRDALHVLEESPACLAL